MRIAHEEWRNERNAYRELIESGHATSGMQGLVNVRTEWMDRAVAAGVSIGFDGEQVKQRINDTALIEEVIERCEPHLGREPGDMPLNVTYLLMWRMLSGATHGYRWAVMPRVAFPEVRETGLGPSDLGGYLTNDEENHVLAVKALALLIGRAFELFDIRRRAPASQSKLP